MNTPADQSSDRLDTTRDAVISSTARDLPQHRDKVKEACIHARFFPHMMEHLPASDEDAVEASKRLVDRADVYIGIFAGRYGHVPPGSSRSVTEIEFDHALQRQITVLPFVADESSITPEMVEASPDAQVKLQQLKKRACDGRIRALFRSVDDLARLVQTALTELRLRDVLQRLEEARREIQAANKRAEQERERFLELERRLARVIATRRKNRQQGRRTGNSRSESVQKE